MNFIDRTIEKPLGDDPPKARLLYGQDLRESLKLVEPHSVQMVATSPPYWGLRDYGGEPGIWGGDAECEHEWGEVGPPHHPGQVAQTNTGGKHGIAAAQGQTAGSGQYCEHCGAWRGHLGLEPTPREFAEHVVEVFEGIRRVLRKDGVVFLNLGDTYFGSTSSSNHKNFGKNMVAEGRWPKDKSVGGTNPNHKNIAWKAAREHPSAYDNLKPKDLVGIPWRVALALQDAGWYLRNDIVWSKGNPMPESVRDRCTRSHEYIFLLAHPDSGGKYFFDTHAIKEGTTRQRTLSSWDARKQNEPVRRGDPGQSGQVNQTDTLASQPGRNKRTVWNVNPKPYPGAHFAVWPEELVEPMVKAGSSEHGCCSKCRAPYKRVLMARSVENTGAAIGGYPARNDAGTRTTDPTGRGGNVLASKYLPGGWEATCGCEGADVVPCVVLDTFSGSATTGAVAMRLGRDYIGTDLQPDYLELATARLEGRKAPKNPDPEDQTPDLIGDLFG